MFALESPAVWLGHGYLQLVAAANSGLADGTAEGSAGGEVLAQVAEPDETRQAITFLIVCLIGIAILLAVLTVWYWQFTSPKRRASSLPSDLGHYEADPGGGKPAEVSLVADSPPMMEAGPSPAPDHIRLPAPAPAPALDDRTVAAPVFAADLADVPPTLAPPELPTNTPRRDVVPEPAPSRRIEVAARAAEPDPSGERKSEAAEPIFPDRSSAGRRQGLADAAPLPVESKTGRASPAANPQALGSTVEGPTAVKPTAPRPADASPAVSRTANPRPAVPSPAVPSPAATTVTQRSEVAAPRPTGGSVPAATRAAKQTMAVESGPARATSASLTERAEAREKPSKTGGSTAVQEGLSDDDWAAVMQSAFSKLNR